MSKTSDRDVACRAAPRDFDRALRIARGIPDAWFRSQALACVARYAPDGLVDGLARDSLSSAREAEEPFRQVAASAWAIRALVERHRGDAAKRALLAVLEILRQVEPAASRAEALDLLWQAGFPGGDELRRPVLEAIARHCQPDTHWRVARLYVTVVGTLLADNAPAAEAIVERLPEGKTKHKTAHLLQRGTTQVPREFFPAAA